MDGPPNHTNSSQLKGKGSLLSSSQVKCEKTKTKSKMIVVELCYKIMNTLKSVLVQTKEGDYID